MIKQKYLPTGQIFDNRKEAKMALGHGKYNKALKNKEIVFVDIPTKDTNQ